jgi:hypothetical protein
VREELEGGLIGEEGEGAEQWRCGPDGRLREEDGREGCGGGRSCGLVVPEVG